jgi:hypothetical protein
MIHFGNWHSEVKILSKAIRKLIPVDEDIHEAKLLFDDINEEEYR